jgi:hypothetical protein
LARVLVREGAVALLSNRQRKWIALAVFVALCVGYSIYLIAADPDLSLSAAGLRDPMLWLTVFIVVAIFAVIVAVMLVLRYVTLIFLHWLERKFVAAVAAPYNSWVVGLARFFYVAMLFCGLTAFGVSLAIWRAPWPHDGSSIAIPWNPLFWLTWIALTAAMMLTGIVIGVLARNALGAMNGRLRKGVERVGRQAE